MAALKHMLSLGWDDVSETQDRDGMPTLTIALERLHEALEVLKRDCGFETVTLVTAIDHSPSEPRFELIHQLLSIQNKDRLRLRCALRGDHPSAPSCTDLWPGATYMERECWDMFGIRFDGHENLRRLLMPEAYGHHPLRKEFPHQGIEPDRLYREWERERIQRAEAKASKEGAGR
jgi:NADH-quinone oxidoreductase subunit C